MEGDSRALWELIVVGLVSGAAGAFLTTLLRIRHERSEQLRERMIAAADDVATGLQQGLMSLGNIQAEDAEAIRRSGRLPEMVTNASDHQAATLARMARVQLLFGGPSPASKAGYKSLGSLLRAIDLLREANPLDRRIAADVSGHIHDATDQMFEFIQQARKAIKRARWHD